MLENPVSSSSKKNQKFKVTISKYKFLYYLTNNMRILEKQVEELRIRIFLPEEIIATKIGFNNNYQQELEGKHY